MKSTCFECPLANWLSTFHRFCSQNCQLVVQKCTLASTIVHTIYNVKWELTRWEVDLLGVDLVGVDFVRVDLMGLTRWKGPGNKASLVHLILPALY